MLNFVRHVFHRFGRPIETDGQVSSLDLETIERHLIDLDDEQDDIRRRLKLLEQQGSPRGFRRDRGR